MNFLRFTLAAFLITGLMVVQLSAQDHPSAMLLSPVESVRAFLPDTTLATPDADSLQTDTVLNPCLPDTNTLNMKIHIPDSTLTESIPVYGGNEIDEGIFIPKFVPCMPYKTYPDGYTKPLSSGEEGNK